jgi:hypothetical protein
LAGVRRELGGPLAEASDNVATVTSRIPQSNGRPDSQLWIASRLCRTLNVLREVIRGATLRTNGDISSSTGSAVAWATGSRVRTNRRRASVY